MSKQTQVPIRVIRMLQPSPEEKEAPIDPISDDIACIRDGAGNFDRGFGRQNFVRIQNQDPLIFERQIFQGPIFLLRPLPVEMKLNNVRAKIFGNFSRTISALRINHENFVRPSHGGETSRQVFRFVLDRDDYRDRNFLRHRGRITLQGFPAAMTFSGTSLVTTEQAPTIARAPIVTPGSTNARAPMNAS